jgi:hypothetical protein
VNKLKNKNLLIYKKGGSTTFVEGVSVCLVLR